MVRQFDHAPNSDCPKVTFPQLLKIMSQNVKLVLVFLAGVALAARVKALPVIGPIIPTI